MSEVTAQFNFLKCRNLIYREDANYDYFVAFDREHELVSYTIYEKKSTTPWKEWSFNIGYTQPTYVILKRPIPITYHFDGNDIFESALRRTPTDLENTFTKWNEALDNSSGRLKMLVEDVYQRLKWK